MRTTERLNALQVKRLAEPGRYPDGGGLYLAVKPGGSKNWLYRFRTRWMGLGAFPVFSLAEARERAAAARKLVSDGRDPIEERRRSRASTRRMMTFKQCAEVFIKAQQGAWKSDKHAGQWRATLETYVYPTIGHLPVDEVDTELVKSILDPIWITKPETASRVRGRIESVLDQAKVLKLRVDENPARWRGNLDKLLPKRSKVRAVKGHAALPYSEIGAFMTDLRKRDGVSPRALEFTILCATRTSETLEARWSEIDVAGKVWTIPASRMKANREHRVPLSDRALAILAEMAALRRGNDDVVFPGARRGKPQSNMALLMTLRRLGRGDLTSHGFRSSFRDWVAEQTNFPGEVAEAALAHVVPNKVEAAYKRTTFFEKRRALMNAWAAYCAGPVDNVVRLKTVP